MKRQKRNYLMHYRHISVDRFEIVKFFSYTSVIMSSDDTIIDIDDWRADKHPNVMAAFDLFFNELREKATKLFKEATGKNYFNHFNDNKTVFQIRDTFTHNTYFIGRKDGRRAVGRHCYMYDGRITDFKTFKTSDYLSDVYADARGTYLKFEVSYGQESSQTNERAKRLCSKYAQKLYNSSVLSNSLNTEMNEQKSADKIEPKFKVGNWYQCIKDFFGKGVTFDKNNAYYCAKEGCLQDEYGCHIAIVKDLYDNFKLWTIEDAKDGDVLACDINKAEIGGDVEKLPNIVSTIFNFKKLINIKDYIHSYCHLYDKRFLGLQRTMYYNSFVYNISPATKEQRELLFQKIKEAGYEWDTEKKELKKK